MIKNYIFLGAPGCGKGTLAQLWQEESKIVHISTGEIFRNEIKNNTELGLKVSAILDAGDYVSDDITNEIVEKRLSQDDVKTNGFILDGYPRTIAQVDFLKSINISISEAILLEADNEIVIERLLARGRNDDKADIIKRRIEIYNNQTKVIIDRFRDTDKLITVSANGTIDENFKELLKAVN